MIAELWALLWIATDPGREPRIIADYTKAIALNPNDAYAYTNRGKRPHLHGKSLRAITLGLLTLALLAKATAAETVNIKYRGPVDLTPFACEAMTRSSFINRVCYDAANQYMIIKLKQTYYHYCEIDAGTVASLKAAESMGRYYNANIKGSGQDGPFDCGTHRVLNY